MDKKPEDVNPQTSLDLIAKAITDPTVQPEKLQQLLVVKKEWEADEARKAFARAIVGFQEACPTVHKSRSMHNNIKFAGKSDIEETIKPVLSAFGLSISIIKTTISDGNLVAEGCIIHRDGHILELSAEIKVDQKMSANDTQKVGSAISYVWRYMFCPALNISLADEVDDDGAGAGSSYITQKQAEEIEVYIGNQDNPDECRGKILALGKCENVETIPSKWYKTVIKKLKAGLEQS